VPPAVLPRVGRPGACLEDRTAPRRERSDPLVTRCYPGPTVAIGRAVGDPQEDRETKNRYAISFQHAEAVKVDPVASGLGATVAPVMFRKDGLLTSCVGTAFCLATLENGEVIFATARHVIDQLIDSTGIEPFLLLPSGMANEQERRSLMGVQIRQISLAETYSDVALLAANFKNGELAVADGPRWLPITFGQPHVGQYCLALGYPQEPRAIGYDILGSRGVIEEIHPRQRDEVFSNFPSFRTTALFKPGMSGGPIIDIHGRAIGIVSHGTEADEPGFVTGYGASIAAIAELKIDLLTNEGQVEEFSIPQLTKMGILGRSDHSAVTLDRADSGVTLLWSPD
jgi:S1-C subfamily serine protease